MECAVLLLKAGASTKLKDYHGNTALLLATEVRVPELVSPLCEHGAKPNVRRKDGHTALSLAVTKDYVDIADALLQYCKPDMTLKAGPEDITPLQIAQRKRRADLIKLLELAHALAGSREPTDGKELEEEMEEKEEEEEEEEDPVASAQVVRVSRVQQDGVVYLVDRDRGIVFSNDLEHPKEVGTWDERTRRVVLAHASEGQESHDEL